MTELRREAREAIAFPVAGWARWNGYEDGVWRGDVCGCSDDRCVGYHHDEHDECYCLTFGLLPRFNRELEAASAAGVPDRVLLTGRFGDRYPS